MALEAWAAATVNDLKDELDSPTSSARLDTRLEGLLNRATSIAEDYTGRRFLPHSAPPYVEYHSLDSDRDTIYLLDWPAASVTSIYEDYDGLYGASTLLDPTTYTLIPGDPDGRSRAKIFRKYDTWYAGRRLYRVTWTPLWTARTQLPYALRDTVLALAAVRWREIERKAQGEVQKSDASGAVFKFMDRSLTTAHLSDEMKAQLDPYRAIDYVNTGERAA